MFQSKSSRVSAKTPLTFRSTPLFYRILTWVSRMSFKIVWETSCLRQQLSWGKTQSLLTRILNALWFKNWIKGIWLAKVTRILKTFSANPSFQQIVTFLFSDPAPFTTNDLFHWQISTIKQNNSSSPDWLPWLLHWINAKLILDWKKLFLFMRALYTDDIPGAKPTIRYYDKSLIRHRHL